MGGKTHLLPYFCDTQYLVRCQFYILQGLWAGKWINLYQTEKYATIMAFDKPTSEKFSPSIRTENMVSSHPLCFTMKYRF